MEDGGNLWIPENANELKLRLLVSAHCGEAGHRGREASLARLRPSRFWSSIEADVASFIEDCLNCVDSKGGGKSRNFWVKQTRSQNRRISALRLFEYRGL